MSNLVVARRSLLLGSAAVALMPAVAFANGPDIGKPAPAVHRRRQQRQDLVAGRSQGQGRGDRDDE